MFWFSLRGQHTLDSTDLSRSELSTKVACSQSAWSSKCGTSAQALSVLLNELLFLHALRQNISGLDFKAMNNGKLSLCAKDNRHEASRPPHELPVSPLGSLRLIVYPLISTFLVLPRTGVMCLARLSMALISYIYTVPARW